MSHSTAFLSFGPFRIDVVNRLLLRHDENVSLTPKAFDTLWALVDQRHRVVPKDELIERVWPDTFVTEATLTQNIYTLRKALGAGDGSVLIRTVPRRGYRFEGEVTTIQAHEGPTSRRQDDRLSMAPNELAPNELGTPESIRSLAVLPLRSLVPGEEDQFLGLGLADAVITSLSNVRQLAVRATSSIVGYVETTDLDPMTVGRDLRVDGILEGTIQRLGSQLRVTLQLVSVARGVPCWAESFQGAYTDLFAAQDAIALEIVSRLRVTLTRHEENRLTHRPTTNLDAYRTYVRGRYLWNQRTASALRRAIELFREAAALDPDFARAYAGLADALILLPFYGAARPRHAFRQARDAARRARDLDPKLADAHTSLAYTDFVYSHDWPSAEHGFRQALEHDPGYPTAYHWYAFLLTALGRHDEAIRLASQAHELEPLSLVISTDLAMACYFATRVDEAVEQLTSVIEVAPTFGYAHFGHALCLSYQSHHDEAIEAARSATELLPDSGAAQAVLGHALGLGGRCNDAREVLRSLTDSNGRTTEQASHRALVLVALDDHDAALDALERGLEERSRFVAFLGVWSAFDPLRTAPRFRALLAHLGLARTIQHNRSERT